MLLSDAVELKTFVLDNSPKIKLPLCPKLHIKIDDYAERMEALEARLKQLNAKIEALGVNRNPSTVGRILNEFVIGFGTSVARIWIASAAPGVTKGLEHVAAAAFAGLTLLSLKAYRYIFG